MDNFIMVKLPIRTEFIVSALTGNGTWRCICDALNMCGESEFSRSYAEGNLERAIEERMADSVATVEAHHG